MGLGWQELFVLLLIGGVVYLLFFSPPMRRRLTGSDKPEDGPAASRGESAEDVLASRYARGEIDQAEYETMRAVIQRNRT